MKIKKTAYIRRFKNICGLEEPDLNKIIKLRLFILTI